MIGVKKLTLKSPEQIEALRKLQLLAAQHDVWLQPPLRTLRLRPTLSVDLAAPGIGVR